MLSVKGVRGAEISDIYRHGNGKAWLRRVLFVRFSKKCSCSSVIFSKMGQCFGRKLKPLPQKPKLKTRGPTVTANGPLQNGQDSAIDDFNREQLRRGSERIMAAELERQMKILIREEIPEIIATVTKAVTSRLTTQYGLSTTTGVATSTPTTESDTTLHTESMETSSFSSTDHEMYMSSTPSTYCDSRASLQGSGLSGDESTEAISSHQVTATAKTPTNNATPRMESTATACNSGADCNNSSAIHTPATDTPTTNTLSVMGAHPCRPADEDVSTSVQPVPARPMLPASVVWMSEHDETNAVKHPGLQRNTCTDTPLETPRSLSQFERAVDYSFSHSLTSSLCIYRDVGRVDFRV